MSFPWQNDSAELEAMEEMPGGILDSTPSPTPSPASSRASSPTPTPSPEPEPDPEIGTRPLMNVRAPRLPPLPRPWFMPPTEAQAQGRIAGHSNSAQAGEASILETQPRHGPSSITVTANNSQPGPSVGKRPLSPSPSNVSSGKRPCRPAAVLASASGLQGQSGRPQAEAPLKSQGGGVSYGRSEEQPLPSIPAYASSSQPSGQAGRIQGSSSSTSRINSPLGAASGRPGQASKVQTRLPLKAPAAPLQQSIASQAEKSSESASLGISEVALGKRPRPSTSMPVSLGHIREFSSTSRAGSLSTPAGSSSSKVTLGKRPQQSATFSTTANKPPGESVGPIREASTISPTAGLSEVALGKQRCRSPDIPIAESQQAGQSGTRKAGDATKTAIPFIYESAKPGRESSTKTQAPVLSEVARGKQRCISPDNSIFEGQQASGSGTRERGSASTTAEAYPLKAATRPVCKSKWATPSGYTSKWATAPAARYTSKWATAQPEGVPDATVQEELDAFEEDVEEEVDVVDEGGAEDFIAFAEDDEEDFIAFEEDDEEDFIAFEEDDEEEFEAFDEEIEEEDLDDREMPIDEDYMDEDEDEDEDDAMSVDEEEPQPDIDDDGMSVDEEERAEEAEDVDMLVDDPEDEDVDMQVDPEPASAAPQDPPVPPQPSNFHYSFYNPPAPQQQEARVPDPRQFLEYFTSHPHPPFFTKSRQEEGYRRPWQSTPARTWTQRSRSYKHWKQAYTRCAAYVPYNPRQRHFQRFRFTPSRRYAQSSPPPVPTYFYPFQNQIPAPSYTSAHFEHRKPQVYSDHRFEGNRYARQGELRETLQYTDEHQPRQSFTQAFVAMVRRFLKRRQGKEIDVQDSNERCVKYAEHEDPRFEEDTEENDQEEEEEDEKEDDEEDQLQAQIIGAYKPESKQKRHLSNARKDRQHEGMLENLAKKIGRLIQENKWIALPAIGLALYSFAPTLVGLLHSG